MSDDRIHPTKLEFQQQDRGILFLTYEQIRKENEQLESDLATIRAALKRTREELERSRNDYMQAENEANTVINLTGSSSGLLRDAVSEVVEDRRKLRTLLRDCPLLHTSTCNLNELKWIERAKEEALKL